MNIIKNFSSWIKSLNESSKSTYEYGCAMVYYTEPQIFKMQDAINPIDIYEETGDNTYGLEDEPHTTLLFGFHNDVDPHEVLSLCKSFPYSNLILHNPSCFNNEKYDVLKFDVEGTALHNVNAKLQEKYKNRFTNSYPNYHPHCTIGYIKKGKGQHYADLFKNIRYTVSPDKLVYSLPSGDKKEISLRN